MERFANGGIVFSSALTPCHVNGKISLHLAGRVKEAKAKEAGRLSFIIDGVRKEAILADKENYNFSL